MISLKRKERDISKLKAAGFKVTRNESVPNEIFVEFHGPEDTPYQGGLWSVIIQFPDDYPYKSPSVGFINKIFHPNIDFASGSICLDVLNQTWTPLYELVNIFETFLPQLLAYPNPNDPLNIEAANLFNKNQQEFKNIVKINVDKFAQNQHHLQEKESGPQ